MATRTQKARERKHGPPPRTPRPAHPHRRGEPLPSQQPKPAEDDPQGPARMREILSSSTYRCADTDADFLLSDELRGLRLQMDYAKAELQLARHRIQHTVVVFGSSRICEPAAAKRAVDAARAGLAADPGNGELERRLAVAERILAKSRYYEVARELGRLVSDANPTHHRSHTVIMTGGGPGIMEAANRGAFEVGAKTVGLHIDLPFEQYPNPYVTAELCFRFRYFALRKLHLLRRAKAVVAFPGGYGTLDEVFQVLALIRTRKMRPLPVVFVGERYWRQAVNVDFLVEEGVIDPEDRELFWFAETAREIWDGLMHWHYAAGERLYPSD